MERLTLEDLKSVCYDPWELCKMDNYCTRGCHEEGGCTKGCHILKIYKESSVLSEVKYPILLANIYHILPVYICRLLKHPNQLLSFDARVCYHDKDHMENVVKGSPFATAYFCRDLLPKDLIIEKLITYERPLIFFY